MAGRVTLDAAMVERCENIGQKRRSLSIQNNRTPGNKASTDYDWAMSKDRLGAFCEGAAWVWLKKQPKWHDVVVGFTNLPDLEINGLKIDVKGVEKCWHTLIVHKVRDDWAYLLVSQEGDISKYLIQGWLWGHEVKTLPIEARNMGRPAYVLPNAKKSETLRNTDELFALAKLTDDSEKKRIIAKYWTDPGDATFIAAWKASLLV